MSETATSKFNCASCGREFRWKPEIAGKRAKCKCGAEVQVPPKDPARGAAAPGAAKAAPRASAASPAGVAKGPAGASRPAPAPAPPPPPPPAEGEPSFDDVFAEAAAEAERAAAANEGAGRAGPGRSPSGDDFDLAPPPPASPAAARPAAQTVAPPGGYAGAVPHRAKIDDTSPVETYHNRWRGAGYAFVGLLICAYAVFEFVGLEQWEETGGRKRMRIWVRFLYMIGGKWAVVLVIGGIGALTVVAGILALLGKLHLESDSD